MTDPTSPIDRVRQAALQLPEAEEGGSDGEAAFFVAGAVFAQLRGDDLLLNNADASEPTVLRLIGDVDWALVEDGIARSWELAAPQRLLEVGGR